MPRSPSRLVSLCQDTELVRLIACTKSQRQLTLPASCPLRAGHYVPVARGACARSPAVYCTVNLPASELRAGDVLFAAPAPGKPAAATTVASVQPVEAAGLYNPYTLGGRIVVDGVLASAHSDWFLEPLLPRATHRFLPAVYQAVLAPVRGIYGLLPKSLARVDSIVHSSFRDGWHDASIAQIAGISLATLASAA